MLPVEVRIGSDDVPARPEDRLVDLEEVPGFRPGMASHPGPRLGAVDAPAFDGDLLQEVGVFVVQQVFPESPTPHRLGPVQDRGGLRFEGQEMLD